MLMSKTVKSVLLVVIAAGIFFLGLISANMFKADSSPDSTTKFPLLAKRIQIDNPNDIRLNFVDLRKDLEDYIEAGHGDIKSSDVSVYFEYLPTGIAININERNESTAASLMKLPLVMTLYKSAEDGSIDLDKSVKLKKEWLDAEFGTLYLKGEGYEITIREAARLALSESDNTAINLIKDVNYNFAASGKDVISYLDFEADLSPDGQQVLVGPRAYSSVLKCLYLSCYNSKENSQQILEYLTQSTFENRIAKNIPKQTKVAHKIGTYLTNTQNDCGIVYLNNNNYLLCIMVEGKDPVASQVIAELSGIIYQKLNSMSDNLK